MAGPFCRRPRCCGTRTDTIKASCYFLGGGAGRRARPGGKGRGGEGAFLHKDAKLRFSFGARRGGGVCMLYTVLILNTPSNLPVLLTAPTRVFSGNPIMVDSASVVVWW